MNSFDQIEDNLKQILVQEKENCKKIYNKEVADALNISEFNYATMKNRESIPFKQIADFCYARKISINAILYNQKLLEDDVIFKYELLKREISILKKMVAEIDVK